MKLDSVVMVVLSDVEFSVSSLVILDEAEFDFVDLRAVSLVEIGSSSNLQNNCPSHDKA